MSAGHDFFYAIWPLTQGHDARDACSTEGCGSCRQHRQRRGGAEDCEIVHELRVEHIHERFLDRARLLPRALLANALVLILIATTPRVQSLPLHSPAWDSTQLYTSRCQVRQVEESLTLPGILYLLFLGEISAHGKRVRPPFSLVHLEKKNVSHLSCCFLLDLHSCH